MRSHPFVGASFVLIGVALVALGALAGSYVPAPLRGLPLPPTIVVPLVLWQLAIWCLLFGAFFLRPRTRSRRPNWRAAPRV